MGVTRLPAVDELGQTRQKQPHFWLVLSIILLFCAALKLPTLTAPHDEPDEQVYWQLAGRLLSSGQYNLHDTPILQALSAPMYDRPLFFHPPLFPLLLIPFVHWQCPSLAVLISWLGHFLCIIAVALMGRRLARELPAGPDGGQLLFWLPVLGMTLDPVVTFVSGKLWIDSLLAGLCAVAMACFFCARDSQRRSLLLVAGSILLGLASLAKLPALALWPVAAFLILTQKSKARPVWRGLVCGFLPALLLVLPWFIIFHRVYGVFLPDWTRPDEWTKQHYPMIRDVVSRTPLYYLGTMACIEPASILCLVGYLFNRSLWRKTDSVLPWVWFLVFFAAMSYVGLRGQGFEMRYLTPLSPCIYLMLYPLLGQWRERSVWPTVLLLCLIYAGLNGAIYLLLPQYDEIRPAFTIRGQANL